MQDVAGDVCEAADVVLRARSVVLLALGCVAVVVVPSIATVVIWTALASVVVAVDVVLAPSPRSLALARDAMGPVRLGASVTSEVTVTNQGGKRAHGMLREAWTPSAHPTPTRHAFDIPAGERRRLRTDLTPTRRGERRLVGVAVRCWGPLGLAGRQRTLPATASVTVLPPFSARRHLPAALERLRTLDGSASVQRRGAGTEFDALRDYVAGDDVRSIDWRATARRGGVVVRTWRPERDRHVVIVVDSSRTSAGRVGDAPRLDAAMDASLLLAALAGAAGDRVELIAVDRRLRASVRGLRGGALMPAIVAALAPVEPALVEADWQLVAAQVRRRMPHRGLVVLATPLEAASAAEGLLPVLPALVARHTVLVASVADPELAELASRRADVGDVHTAAAASRTIVERHALVALVRREGARVVDAAPASLPPALADAYLDLKAAGAL